jgi:hypothetical protein
MVTVTVTLDYANKLDRYIVLSTTDLDWNMNDLKPQIQVGKDTTTYNTPTTTTMAIFVSDVRMGIGITGLTTSDVTGAIVGGAALASLTLTPNTSLGEGYYTLAYTAIATGSKIQLTFTKSGYNFTELNLKQSVAVPA